MDFNLSSLRQRVMIDKLDDEDYDPGVIDRFINDTLRSIYNSFELPFMEKIFSGSISTGATMFALPPDVAVTQAQVVTAPDGKQFDLKSKYLDFRTFNQMYPTPANNTPSEIRHWTSYAGNILLSAPTDQDYTMTTFYIKKPTVLIEDTDIPEFPEEFSEALILGALKRIHKRNEDEDLAQSAEVEFSGEMMKMADRYGFRISSGPIKMKNRQIR